MKALFSRAIDLASVVLASNKVHVHYKCFILQLMKGIRKYCYFFPFIISKVLLHSPFSQINNGRIRTKEGNVRKAENIRDDRNDLYEVT